MNAFPRCLAICSFLIELRLVTPKMAELSFSYFKRLIGRLEIRDDFFTFLKLKTTRKRTEVPIPFLHVSITKRKIYMYVNNYICYLKIKHRFLFLLYVEFIELAWKKYEW